jgi:hypothetical protein
MFYGSGSRLSAELRFSAVTCPMTLNLISYLRWTPALPRTLWLRTSSPSWGGHRRCHVSYGFIPHLPAEVDYDAATCPMAPDLASRLRWALALSCVLWLQTLSPGWGRLRRCYVSYDSGPHLPAEVGFGAVTCPTGSPWAMSLSIKKRLTGLTVQIGMHVHNARA